MLRFDFLLALVLLEVARGVAFEVVAGGEGDADGEGDEAGQEPGAEVQGNGVEGWRQDEADGVEADGERETDHGDDEARPQDATAAALFFEQAWIEAVGDHSHALAVLEIAQQHHEAKKEGQGNNPTEQDR